MSRRTLAAFEKKLEEQIRAAGNAYVYAVQKRGEVLADLDQAVAVAKANLEALDGIRNMPVLKREPRAARKTPKTDKPQGE